MPTPNSLINRLFYYAENHPSHDAIATPTLTLTYAQLAQLVLSQVAAFNNANISSDAVIGISCADDTKHLLLCLAATHLGATSCTIPTHETDQAQKAIISRCGATHIIDEAIAVDPAAVNPIPPPLSLDNNAGAESAQSTTPEARLLFSTSGSTGEPKLVVHYDRDVVAQAHRHIGSKQERFTCLASMEHNFSKRHRLYCVAAGATNVFLSPARETLVAQCQSLSVNVIHVSAFQAQELLATTDINKLSNIRLKLGGSHVPMPLRKQLRDNISTQLQAGYGTTETGAIAFTDPNDLNAGESVGQALPGIEIHAVTAERKPLGVGKRGELAVRCDGMFREYLGNPELTASRLRDGWFYTGDIGYLDSQQRIHLCGRSDDMFVFNSMNIYPQDIESVIRQHPDIMDAAVLPKISAVHGNIPVALIVFAKNSKQKLPSLKKFVQKRVGVRSPRQYLIVDKIPTNASGKISRREAINLPVQSGKIRHDIIKILDPSIAKQLKPALIAAFKNGETDISFDELGMDSLARMNFLIALETDYNTIITPREFAKYRYLGNIATRVLSPPSQPELQQNTAPATSDTAIKTNTPPYVVSFFQRIFSYCHTVAQLNKALATLDHRLTPIEMECLYDWHCNGQLIPKEAAIKFQTAISHWLKETKAMMLHSKKPLAEPFSSRRMAPTVALFSGPGSPTGKTLLICFSPKGLRHLQMPNAVLMQHTNAARYDVLIISEPLNKGYLSGVPPFSKNLMEVIEWLAKQHEINAYNSIRTLGFSAGSYPAVVAGYLLKAEMAVSVSGRFHKKKRHPLKNLAKLITIWKAARQGHCPRVLISYATDNSRDRKYARVIAKISAGSIVSVKCNNGKIGHLLLQWLLESGELAHYFGQTIFSEMDGKTIATKQENTTISFPTAEKTAN